jgi:cell division protein FtsW
VLLALAWLIPLLGALWTLQRAPDWLEPREVRIDLAPGQSAILGHDRAQRRDDLWSPHAEAEHVRILRTASGDWRLENVAASKQVLWKPRGAQDYRRVREWRLMPGGPFAVGEHRFVATAVAADGLTLQSASQTWRYDGVYLYSNGQALPPCDPGGLEALLSRLPAHLRRARPLGLGGGVQCATRLGLAGVPADSVVIVSTAAGYVLRPGPAARPDGPPVFVGGEAEGRAPLRELTVPLASGDPLIVGYTGYRVTQTAGALTLAVTARGQRWPAADPRPASLPAVRVTLTPFTFLRGPEWPVVLALLAPWGIGLLWLRGRYPLGPAWPARLGLLLCLSLAGGALALYFWNDAGSILWPYALAWLALAGLGWMARRTAWSALLVGLLTWLLGWGLVAQLQLGVGADESAWLRYGNSTAALAGLFGWLLLAGSIFWREFRPGWPSARLATLSVVLPGAASLGLLGLQVFFGDEAGWGGFQPFELTKLALVVAAAAALAQRMSLRGWDLTFSKPQLWWRYLWPVLILAVLVMVALGFLHDFSPLVLLAIGALALAWAYLRIHPDRRWRLGGQGVLAAVAVVLVLGVMQLRQHPAWFPTDLQSDRIQVWAAPERYPHAGYQLRQALAAIRAGGWWGANAGTLPGNAQPGRNGGAMAIPAVQDDFAPAFFLNRYGGVAGLTLLAAQILLVLALWHISARALDLTCQNDHRRQTLGWFAYFALAGGGGLLAAHGLVSWGTNLGFLPVMGQPMPLLAAAGSHLILLTGPIIALALALEEGHPHAA